MKPNLPPPDARPARLLQLVRDNRDTPRQAFTTVRNSADATTLYLYDVIDAYWGIAALAFVQALNAIATPIIHLRINSPGGDVFEARAMATALRAHPSHIVAHIDGQALSAASTVAMAANEVRIADGAFLMIHNAWTLAMGNAADLRSTAELLDQVDIAIGADYQRKTGKTEQEIADWMAAETWFNAADAVANGFADSVDDGAATQNHWNLAAYTHVPQALKTPPPPRRDAVADNRATLARRLTLFERT